MTIFSNSFLQGAGFAAGALVVILAALLLLGCYDKVKELARAARLLRKGKESEPEA